MKVSWLISFLLCIGFNAGAQIMIVPREKLDAISNPRMSDYARFLRFEQTAITADPMNEDDGVRTFSYPFENIGKDTLVIRRLVTTCSCVVAVCQKDIVPPGQMSEIILKYNPKGHPGRFERKAFVYVGEEDAPAAILRLSVSVERGADYSGMFPISMGNIRMRCSDVHLKRGVKAVERCAFVNVSDKALRLECEKAMLPACITFMTEPEVVAPGEEGRIVISYDPSKGGERNRVPVIVKGLGVPPSQSTITVIMNEK